MASKAKSKSGASSTSATASNSNKLTVTEKEGKSRERLVAEIGLSPAVSNAQTARTFAKGVAGEIDLSEAVALMREKVALVKAGDLSGMEETLTVQAATLDAIFNELACRASQNMGTYLSATETYLRMAFKAQAQCRATLETLAEVKYPKAATFVRQQNVAYQQQVNNDGIENTRTDTNAR